MTNEELVARVRELEAECDERKRSDYYDDLVQVTRERDALRALLMRVRKSRHWPEEGQAWGYLLDEATHDAIDAALEVRPARTQVDDLLSEIRIRALKEKK